MKEIELKTGYVDKIYRYLSVLKLVYIIGSVLGGFLFPIYYEIEYNAGNILLGFLLFFFFGFFIFPVFAFTGKIIPIIVTICFICLSIMIARESICFSNRKNIEIFDNMNKKNKIWEKVMVFAIVLSIAFNISFICYHFYYVDSTNKVISEKESEIEQMEQDISRKDEIIQDKEQEISEQKQRRVQSEREMLLMSDELEFWREYAVIVTTTGEKYHTYGCQYIYGRNFWIYNIDAAIQRGYESCSVCNPPTNR